MRLVISGCKYAINKVESVQLQFTQKVKWFERHELTGEICQKHYKSPEKWRVIADLILINRIMFGLDDIKSSDYSTVILIGYNKQKIFQVTLDEGMHGTFKAGGFELKCL